MDKLKMHSLNKVEDNIKRITALFPNCVTERKNEAGEVERAIDFDLLRQELSSVIVEGNEERYRFEWPDKKKSILLANSPISATLRPCREESVDFDTTENLYIEGDNLDVLKLLQETYLGKIKMIYIDPPYNTGSDFVYEDDFSIESGVWRVESGDYDEQGNRLVQNTESNGRFHTDWLNMIYPRLKLAKDLLRDAEQRLRSESLFLYYMQLGRCMYTGERIDITKLKTDGIYNIDHIYPRCFVKDDSVINNKVLVLSKANSDKGDQYPVPDEFRKNPGVRAHWDMLHKAGLISDEKYYRLTRTKAFTDDEKMG